MQHRWYGAALVAALVLAFSPAPGHAQDVRLTARDGSLSLDGMLIGFDGEFYRIDTVYGTLTVDALGVVCAGPGCPELEAYVAEATFAGSESMGLALIPALIEAFAAGRGLPVRREIAADGGFRYVLSAPEGRDIARFAFRLATTDSGLDALIDGEAEVAMATREVRADELARAREAGLGNLAAPTQGRIVALDAIVVAVAPENPLVAITPEAATDALSGDAEGWVDLGGDAAEALQLHALDGALGTQQAIEAALMAPAGRAVAEDAQRHADPAALADAVARDPGALGVTLASSLGNARALPLAGACGFALAPDEAAIRSEDYPFVAPLFLYTPARRLPALLRDFLGFLSTPAAGRVIRRAGFVDLGARRLPLAQQGERLARAVLAAGAETTLPELQQMIRALEGAERLSPTFRFRAGAAGLDAPSRGAALLLAEALEAGVYDGREVVFVGFSDGEGPAATNLRIARDRAESVLAAVRALAETADFSRVRLTAAAFGEALPMACDDSDWGRRVNRRVEVWLR